MIPGLIGRLAQAGVGKALARPRLAIGLSLAAGIVSFVYLLGAFSVRTDIDSLISKDLPWRRAETALEKAFISQGPDLSVVVDAPTPEEADHAANLLAAKLSARSDAFTIVQRQDGGPYLEREALLFLPLDQVKGAAARLIDAQPFLGPLAADPSLRGVAGAVETSLTGAEQDRERLAKLAPVFGQLDKALATVEAGRPRAFSWRSLMTGETPSPGDLHKVVSLTPKLDEDAVQPGARAIAAIHKAMSDIGLSADLKAATHARITGSVAMETDELANLTEATGPIAVVCLLAMLGILFWGVRSAAVIGAIAMTVLTGLVITASLGLLVFGRFTLVSVAFLPLFVGLGIDFAIQFAIRYRAEATTIRNHDLALVATGLTAGPGVALAAAATGFGFLSFWPTPYKGVSELGLIAGVGMIVGAVLALTLLPAWLKVLRAGAASSQEDLVGFARLYRIAEQRRVALLTAAGAAVAVGLVLLPGLRFDFDPISLRSTRDVSVSTFRELTHNPDITPNRLQALARNPAEAEALAAQLRRSPTVAQVYTAQSLVPPDQPAKLAVIRDAALLLDTTLSPFDVAPPPSDAEIAAALARAGARLKAVAGSGTTEGQVTARNLGERLEHLATAAAPARSLAAHVLTDSLTPALDQVRASLTAEPVTLDTLPPEIRREWISAAGEARVDIGPSGDPADPKNLARFVTAVRQIAPDVSGPPLAVIEAGNTILGAFVEAGILSTLAIAVLLTAILRSLRDVALTIAPVLATLIFTLATLVLLHQPINLENLIALPLLLGIGVSFNIYSVIAWREGASRRTRASLSHAILFSALTTGASFLALALSAHPGTASLGLLLLVTLGWTLVGALFLQPALLAAVRGRPKD